MNNSLILKILRRPDVMTFNLRTLSCQHIIIFAYIISPFSVICGLFIM